MLSGAILVFVNIMIAQKLMGWFTKITKDQKCDQA